MKKTIIVFAALFALSSYAAEVDGVVATVNTHQILRSDVLSEMARLGVHASEYSNILNELINRKLILKAAGDAKMTIQEWVIENRVREIINRSFSGDRNKLMETLSRNKIAYPEWYARIREDMIISAMRWNAVEKHATASPAAMMKMYSNNPERYAEGAKVSVSVITLTPAESSKREEISEALKTKDFSEFAKAYPDIVPEDVFSPVICEEIREMPKGTISHWIDIGGWSFLVKKDDEKPGKARTFVEAYDDVEMDVRAEESKRIYDAWIQRLRAEAYIKVY